MEQNNKYENIFELGCLVQLRIGMLGVKRGLTEEERALVYKKQDLDKKWVSGGKNIIDPGSLAEIGKIKSEAREYLRRVSLPFPIRGALFVGFEVVERIDGMLKGFKEGFEKERGEFEGRWGDLVEGAREALKVKGESGEEIGTLFNRLDYPAEVGSCFIFEWQFITMQAPGKGGFLSPELVKREQEKFIGVMEEAREMGVMALRVEFKEILDSCVERLTEGEGGKKKVFRDSLVGNFWDFFEGFKDKGIFEDRELEVLCEQAKGILSGVDVGDLRKDEGLREVVKVSMGALSGELEKAIVDAPGRKLKL